MNVTFYNGRIFDGTEFFTGTVRVSDNVIQEIGEGIHENYKERFEKGKGRDSFDEKHVSEQHFRNRKQSPIGDTLVDLNGGTLLPAFIDLQLYGGNGFLFGEHPSVEALKATVEYSRNGGATTIFPTVATNSMDIVLAAIEAVREYWEIGLPGVGGLHLEGPFINPEKRGAHIAELISVPEMDKVKELVQAGKGIIRIMTLAPEVCSFEVIEYLQQHGIMVSAGHSNASFQMANEAFKRGIRLTTHLFNAMSPLQHRAPGLAGAAMYNDQVYASIIADGHHVDYPVIKIAKKAMGERLFLITDAVTTNNSGYYRHQLQDDKYVMPDGTLSGSALTMLKAVNNLIAHAGITEGEAYRMASLYAARAMKLDDELGSISVGKKAELIWLDNERRLQGIFSNGSVAHIST